MQLPALVYTFSVLIVVVVGGMFVVVGCLLLVECLLVLDDLLVSHCKREKREE
jgi:ABC-type branched-subunit amino acid transport system permease subunit